MDRDNHASCAKVGFTVVAGFAAVVAALLYFGGIGRGGGEFLAETYYNASVSGLSVGSEVNFRGVAVGAVKSISFIGADYPDAADADRGKIRIVLAFNDKMARTRQGVSPREVLEHFVSRGMRATVSPSGITGLSKIELNFSSLATAEEPLSWTPEHFCIPPAPSMLEGFADSATKIMNHLKNMDFGTAYASLTSTVSSAGRAVDEVRALVVDERPALDAILSNLEGASATLKDFAERIRDEPSLLLRSRDERPLPETSVR